MQFIFGVVLLAWIQLACSQDVTKDSTIRRVYIQKIKKNDQYFDEFVFFFYPWPTVGLMHLKFNLLKDLNAVKCRVSAEMRLSSNAYQPAPFIESYDICRISRNIGTLMEGTSSIRYLFHPFLETFDTLIRPCPYTAGRFERWQPIDKLFLPETWHTNDGRVTMVCTEYETEILSVIATYTDVKRGILSTYIGIV